MYIFCAFPLFTVYCLFLIYSVFQSSGVELPINALLEALTEAPARDSLAEPAHLPSQPHNLSPSPFSTTQGRKGLVQACGTSGSGHSEVVLANFQHILWTENEY